MQFLLADPLDNALETRSQCAFVGVPAIAVFEIGQEEIQFPFKRLLRVIVLRIEIQMQDGVLQPFFLQLADG